jgi:N-acetylglucosaminyldiphosphoundecaprenol N-acetyl-beta-D-mannosaminyltransferase
MIDFGKRNLLGIGINAVDYESAVASILDAAKNSKPMGISALAVHGVMTGVFDREHCYRLNQLEMVVPDGQPVRWGLNLVHRVGLPDRVYGPNLTLKVCEAAAEQGLSIFLFGGTEAMLNKFKSRLEQLFPKIQIVGFRQSKFRRMTTEERDELAEHIQSTGAKITLVGIGCPRQEVWAYEFRGILSMPILAVGAAFAFHAGELKQAPIWMQDRGLEWFYRLTREPKRLWRRYLFLNPAYLTLLALQWSRLYTLKPDRGEKPTEQILYG